MLLRYASAALNSATLRGFHDGGDAHASGGANGNQSAPRSFFAEQFGHISDDARAGRCKGMADCETATFDIELAQIDRTKRLIAA